MKCTSCKSREAKPGAKSCQYCIDKAAARTSAKREQLKNQGLCIRCRKRPAAEGHTACQECLDADTKRATETYQERRAKGLCTHCGQSPAAFGPYCQACHERIFEWAEHRTSERQAAGVCTHCGKEPIAETSDYLCATCLEKGSRRAESRRARRRAVNQCHVCGTPIRTGYQLCDRCRAARNHREQDGYFNGLRPVVLERDHYTCRLCYRVLAPEDCRVHHMDITGKTDTPNNDIANLITLCNPCHLRIHTILRKTKDRSLLVRLIEQAGV